MVALPILPDVEAFRAWRADPSHWLPAALDIARSEGLPHADPKPFLTGTNLVVALDERLVLKIFPPVLRAQFISERASLSQLRGRLGIPVPEIVRQGEREQWPYLVITRLHGVLGAEAWPHKFLAGLDDFLAEATPLIPINAAPVILTGEYIPENFLLRRETSGWQLSGLIDFGDVLTGWGEYDLLGPSAFMTAGMPGRVRSLLKGFGYSSGDISPALKHRLMALMLLHRASDPVRHICIDGWQQKADSLFELAELLWPV
jgi:hygromycin-B 7''-O-kinase